MSQASVPALGHFLLYPKQEQGPDCTVKVVGGGGGLGQGQGEGKGGINICVRCSR